MTHRPYSRTRRAVALTLGAIGVCCALVRPSFAAQAVKPNHTHAVVAPTTSATEVTIEVTSRALGGRREPVIVLLPPGYDPSGKVRYPVVYLLHGNPGSPRQFFTQGGIGQLAGNLMDQHKIVPMILVMPTGAPSFTQDEEWANTARPGNGWETFVASDLVRAIDARYPTVVDGRGRAIGGLSTGGYGALNIAFHHVGEFGLVEAWSAYYRADNSQGLFGTNSATVAYNSPMVELPRVADQLRAAHTFIWLYNGSDETYRGSEYFIDALARLHIDYRWALFSGTHNWYLWRPHLPDALTAASTYFQHGPPPLSTVPPPTPLAVPTSDLPKIDIRTSMVALDRSGSGITVTLSCARAACSGSVEMVGTPGSGSAVVVLAKAAYELRNREIANVDLPLTAAGHQELEAASIAAPRFERVTAVVVGGQGGSKRILVN